MTTLFVSWYSFQTVPNIGKLFLVRIITFALGEHGKEMMTNEGKTRPQIGEKHLS
jgi:hypothetical protein